MRAAEISIPALQHNVRTLRARTGKRIIVVVKADAYGHGATLVVPAVIAAGADMVAVASISEAIALRSQECTAPILCWLHSDVHDFRQALTHDIDLGVSLIGQLDRIWELAHELGRQANVHLKVDTGLSRNGASPACWNVLCETAAAAEGAGAIRVQSIFSHLANAGEASDRAQAARYDIALHTARQYGLSPTYEHLAASAAALTHSWLNYNTIRVGLAAYGLSPLDDHTSHTLGLRPALRLSAEVISISHHGAGTALGHLPLGYADGLPRALTSSGRPGPGVRIGERLAPLIDPVEMDECTVDITGHGSSVQVGDRAVFFGDPARGDPMIDAWAHTLNTINYEVIARLGTRIHRVAVQDFQDPQIGTPA